MIIGGGGGREREEGTKTKLLELQILEQQKIK